MTATQQRCYGVVNEMNKARFEAFSDGVFAFAITLLILGVSLPAFQQRPSDAELGRALLGLWPNVLAYALSFAVIGIMWQNHHALFRLIERVDRTTVFYNLLLLSATVFIPFATSVLGTYEMMHSSTLLYGIVLTLARALGEFGAIAVVSGGLVGKTQTLTLYVQQEFQNFDPVGAYAAAFLLALLAIVALIVINVVRPKEHRS